MSGFIMSQRSVFPVFRIAGIMFLLCSVFVFTAPVMAADEETLSISGSTTVLPIAAACAEAFMDKHPNVDIQVSGGGSGAGIKAIGEGVVALRWHPVN
jgi:phosphate transport system substrate-binding protein